MTLRAPKPQAIVVFGASGDLATKKIIPALYDLAVRGLLPEHYCIIGYAMDPWDDEAFRRHAHASIEAHSRTPLDEAVWRPFADSLSFISGTFDDDELMVGASSTWPWTAYILADAPDLDAVRRVTNILRETPVGSHRLWRYMRVEARIGRPLFFGND